jgi:hypothetical protein
MNMVSGAGGVSDTDIVTTYATLLNNKLVIPSVSAPYVSVDQHFFFRLMKGVVKNISVDENWYLAKNPDVAEAIKRGAVKSGREHYLCFGYYEHRMPYKIVVVETWYLKSYPDVQAAVAKQVYSDAQTHFEIRGFREGRLPYANFSFGERPE